MKKVKKIIVGVTPVASAESSALSKVEIAKEMINPNRALTPGLKGCHQNFAVKKTFNESSTG